MRAPKHYEHGTTDLERLPDLPCHRAISLIQQSSVEPHARCAATECILQQTRQLVAVGGAPSRQQIPRRVVNAFDGFDSDFQQMHLP